MALSGRFWRGRKAKFEVIGQGPQTARCGFRRGPKRWNWPLSWTSFSQGRGKAPTVCATVRSWAIGRPLHNRVVIAMRHMKWEDSEDDAQVELGDGIALPLVRLVRLCEYLNDSSNRKDAQRPSSPARSCFIVACRSCAEDDGQPRSL